MHAEKQDLYYQSAAKSTAKAHINDMLEDADPAVAQQAREQLRVY
jgi:cell division protein FtsB